MRKELSVLFIFFLSNLSILFSANYTSVPFEKAPYIRYPSIFKDSNSNLHMCFIRVSDFGPGEVSYLIYLKKTPDGVITEEVIEKGVSFRKTDIKVDNNGNVYVFYSCNSFGYGSFLKVAQKNSNQNIWNISYIDRLSNSESFAVSISTDNIPFILYRGEESTVTDPSFICLIYAYLKNNTWYKQSVDVSAALSRLNLSFDKKNIPKICGMSSESLVFLENIEGSWAETIVDKGTNNGSTDGLIGMEVLEDKVNISYFKYYSDSANYIFDLRYAVFTGSSWQVENILNENGRCTNTYIKTDLSGNINILYFIPQNGLIKLVKKTPSGWLQPETVMSGIYFEAYDWYIDDDGVVYILFSKENSGEGVTSIRLKTNKNGVWKEETIKESFLSFNNVSVELDTSAVPCISFLTLDCSLYFAKFNKTNARWEINKIEDGVSVVKHHLALFNNIPHIVYYDQTNYMIKYAYFNNNTNLWEKYNIAISTNLIELYLAVDKNGIPHISFLDREISVYPHYYSLKYTSYNPTENMWNIPVLVDGWQHYGFGGLFSVGAFKLSSDNKPSFCYTKQDIPSTFSLNYSVQNDTGGWTQIKITTFPGDPNFSKISFVSNNNVLNIAYSSNDNLYYSSYNIQTSQFYNIEITTEGTSTGNFLDIFLDKNALPIICYTYSDNMINRIYIKVAKFSGSNWTREEIYSSSFYLSDVAKDNNDNFHFFTSSYLRPNNPPLLEWIGQTNYVSDGLHPESGDVTTNFVYRVKYRDPDGDAPAPTSVKLKIRSGDYEIIGSPFLMQQIGSGNTYYYSIKLPAGYDYAYQFEAEDIWGEKAIGQPAQPVNAPDVDGTNCYIKGYVLDNKGKGLADAKVSLYEGYVVLKEITTGSNGYFEFTGLTQKPNVNYYVEVSKSGWSFVPQKRIYVLNKTYDNEIFIGNITGVLQGKISDLDNVGIPNARIDALMNNQLRRTFFSDYQGNFRVVVVTGTYTLCISKEGYTTKTYSGIIVLPGQTTNIDLLLTKGNFKGWNLVGYDAGNSFSYPYSSNYSIGSLDLKWIQFGVKKVLTGDINNDGYLEIVTTDGDFLRVYDFTGGLLWSVATKGELNILSNISSDSALEIVTSYKDNNNRLVLEIYDGNGVLLGNLVYPEQLYGTKLYTFWASGNKILCKLISDKISSNSKQGIVAFDFETKLKLWEFNTAFNPDIISVADVDGDGVSDIIFGGLTTKTGNVLGQTNDNEMFVISLNEEGEVNFIRAFSEITQNISGRSSALVIDINNDYINDIIVLESHNKENPGSNKVYFLSSDGVIISSCVLGENLGEMIQNDGVRALSGGIVVDDINTDGTKEMFISCSNGGIYKISSDLSSKELFNKNLQILVVGEMTGDANKELICWDKLNQEIVVLKNDLVTILYKYKLQAEQNVSAIISDLDNDSRNEVLVVGENNGLYVLGALRVTAPLLLSPSNNSSFSIPNPPTFMWKKLLTAKKYEIQISSNWYNFSTGVTTEVVSAQYTPSVSLEPGLWSWRVRSFDGVNWSGYTEPWLFRIESYEGLKPTPDLVITDISYEPLTPSIEQLITINVKVKNVGTTGISRPFWVDFYENLTSSPTIGQTGNTYWLVKTLAAGEEKVLKGGYVFDGKIHKMYAQIDTDNEIGESDENNNIFKIEAFKDIIPPGELRGKVFSKIDGKGIPFASVEALQENQVVVNTKTDLNGAYKLSLFPGEYEIRFIADDYDIFVTTVSISSTVSVIKNCSLGMSTTGYGFLSGIVKKTDEVTYLPGAKIKISNLDETFTRIVFSNKIGTYRMRLTTGTYNVSVEMTGYEPKYVSSIEIKENQITTQDFVLSVSTIAPLPAAELYATPLENSSVRLDWLDSVSEDVVTYRIYCVPESVGYDKLFNIFVDTVPVGQQYWVSPQLIRGETYLFSVRPVNSLGVENGDTNLIAKTTVVGTTAADIIKAVIKTPQTGKKFAGNTLTVLAEIVSGNPFYCKKVWFEYKPTYQDEWLPIPSKSVVRQNPVEIWPYYIQWDISQLQEGNYDVRAVAYNMGDIPDPLPISITITYNTTDYDYLEVSYSSDTIERKEIIYKQRNNRIRIGSDEKIGILDINVPNGSIADTTDKLGVIYTTSLSTSSLGPSIPSTLKLSKKTNVLISGPLNFLSLNKYILISLDSKKSKFNSNISVSIPYYDTDSDGVIDGTDISEENIQVFYYDPNSSNWQKVNNIEVDKQNNIVKFNTQNLAAFGLFASKFSPQIQGEVLVYPNPFVPSRGHSKMYFINLPENTTIKVYNIAGEMVFEKKGINNYTYEWNVVNNNNAPLASGVYFYVIKTPQNKKIIKKFCIIR
ncbi:MAG: carboxypeptidase regulatory-like domain-containing protein [Endomicrobia bacterium]|nr:carboxypeptidase regulatory-like domain-containing protein [Endomicrobiia bacterium]